MIPGNTDPNRYRAASYLSAALLALVAAGASAPEILSQFLDEKEGVRLVAYPDGKKIWTICRGLTRIGGKPVTQGMRLSKADCDQLDAQELIQTLAVLERIVRPEVWRGLSPVNRAGIASFCTYNIGADRCKETAFLTLLNAGRRNEACAQITRWIRDGGKDCRVDSSCRGQPTRRMQEDEMCLMAEAGPQ